MPNKEGHFEGRKWVEPKAPDKPSWTDKKEEYLAFAREVEPAVRLTTKDGWVWKVTAALLHAFTGAWIKKGMGISRQVFLEQYATTFGPIQAYPRHWKDLSRKLLRHEARHTRQCRWFGFGIHPWVGFPLFAIVYILLFLPLGFAFFRWRFEIDADRASWRFQLNRGKSPDEIRWRANNFGKKVCGGNYGWSWIIGGVRGFEKAAEKTIAEFETKPGK